MQVKIRAAYMRGGSCKGLFFHQNHLPSDNKARDMVILSAYGSPDPNRLQIDGLGGATSSTSKVAIISPSKDPNYDVNYTFGQVSFDKSIIDYRGNCGNLSSAVGPFAIDEGLVTAEEPITQVRIYQTNTKKRILAEVPVKDGRHIIDGDFVIDGVPGSGARIAVHFYDPAGSVTGRLLPTGNVKDYITVPDIGKVTISIVDASNPVVFVKANELGLKGTEISEIDSSKEIKKKLELIRSQAAVMIGFASTPEEATEKSQAFPKIAIIGPPQDYDTVKGLRIVKKDIDLVARQVSMGKLNKVLAVTVAICCAGAAKIEGTVINDTVVETGEQKEIRLGHPGGILPIEPRLKRNENDVEYVEAIVGRTARRLMDGHVYVPEKLISK